MMASDNTSLLADISLAKAELAANMDEGTLLKLRTLQTQLKVGEPLGRRCRLIPSPRGRGE